MTSAVSIVVLTVPSLFSVSRVVDPGAILGDSAGMLSKGENTPSLRCSDEGLR